MNFYMLLQYWQPEYKQRKGQNVRGEEKKTEGGEIGKQRA